MVSAVIVTRGDVDLGPVIASIPEEWERIVWTNGHGAHRVSPPGWTYRYHTDDGGVSQDTLPEGGEGWFVDNTDFGVFGRYTAIEYATGTLIYVQDDDVIVSDPQAIVDEWKRRSAYPYDGRQPDALPDPRDFVDHVVCNMPPEFRHDFYKDHALVGFGAVFHRHAPARVFELYNGWVGEPDPFFNRTCDIVFTGLSPRVLVDVSVESLPVAYGFDRMWRQPDHMSERMATLERVRRLR